MNDTAHTRDVLNNRKRKYNTQISTAEILAHAYE